MHACRQACWGFPFGPVVVTNPKPPRESFLHAYSMHACMHISCMHITRACDIHNITMTPAIDCALSSRSHEIIMILVMQDNLQRPATLSSSKSPCTAFQRSLGGLLRALQSLNHSLQARPPGFFPPGKLPAGKCLAAEKANFGRCAPRSRGSILHPRPVCCCLSLFVAVRGPAV